MIVYFEQQHCLHHGIKCSILQQETCLSAISAATFAAFFWHHSSFIFSISLCTTLFVPDVDYLARSTLQCP
jgi:hypothetical protein